MEIEDEEKGCHSGKRLVISTLWHPVGFADEGNVCREFGGK